MANHPFTVIKGNTHPYRLSNHLFDPAFLPHMRHDFQNILIQTGIETAFIEAYNDRLDVRFETQADHDLFMKHICKAPPQTTKPKLSVVSGLCPDQYPATYRFQQAALGADPEKEITARLDQLGIRDYQIYKDNRFVDIFFRTSKDMLAVHMDDCARQRPHNNTHPRQEV